MKQGIKIVGGILLAAALSSPAWAGHAHGKGGPPGGESQAGGLPGLEDRVEADEALITTLQGQNNWAVVDVSCTVARSNTGAVTSSPVSGGVCEVFFAKDVSGCAYEATIGDVAGVAVAPGFITVSGDTDADSNHDVFVRTFSPLGVATSFPFHLTVTCP